MTCALGPRLGFLAHTPSCTSQLDCRYEYVGSAASQDAEECAT
jgi:hypothetical protein